MVDQLMDRIRNEVLRNILGQTMKQEEKDNGTDNKGNMLEEERRNADNNKARCNWQGVTVVTEFVAL